MATVTPELSDLQREVLGLLAQGHSVPAIAHLTWKSIPTIRYHEKRIRAYFGVTSTPAAVAKAREWDMVGEAS